MEIFSFGERLMIYRKRAGLSKKELAKRVGIVFRHLPSMKMTNHNRMLICLPIWLLHLTYLL